MQYLDNHFTSSEARAIRKAITAIERRVLIHQDVLSITAIERRVLIHQDVLSSPELTRRYCQLQLARSMDEQFGCLFLTSQHRVITFERLFQGTVDGASVYPRVIVRRCLELNAAAVIFTHNHPSGVCEPSEADARITDRLRSALQLIDVRVLDHVIVSQQGFTSMAEMGRL